MVTAPLQKPCSARTRDDALAMREVAEGHEIANHTYNHPNLTKISPLQVQDELRKGAEAIKRAQQAIVRLQLAKRFFRARLAIGSQRDTAEQHRKLRGIQRDVR